MHSIKYRTYYEDTDAQGVVYYANYLRFIERARTEYLREFGYQQKELLDKNVIFIVRKLSIKYLSPVYLDETIRIESNLKKVKKLSFNFYKKFIMKIIKKFAKQRFSVAQLMLKLENLRCCH